MNVIQTLNDPDDTGIDPAELADPVAARRAFRDGFKRQTAGVAAGHVQANLCIVPKDYAEHFLRFCQRNPKPCPLLAASDPGDPRLPEIGEDLDIRTDLPSYRVWRDGEPVETVRDVRHVWQDDLVSFALGCSFSFEQALVDDGLPLPHIEKGVGVPMFLTNIECAPAGPFSGPMVVSMRSFKPADAIRAIQITSRFPRVHGAPVHIGKPEMIGVNDLVQDAFGYPTPVPDDHLPLFWACGVTPQSVVTNAKPPLCITHEPSYMLVTDLNNASLASF